VTQNSAISRSLAIAVATFLMLAVGSRWPYGVYTLLRFTVCISAIYFAVHSYELKRLPWAWIMGSMGVVFNPFIPFRFPRNQWQILDLGTAAVFAFWVWRVCMPESDRQQFKVPVQISNATEPDHRPATLATTSLADTAPRIKFLVGEDDRTVADLIAQTLAQGDCETAVECSGLDAVYRAATFRPDVALLGFVMPDMDGVEAGINILKISPKTKVVLINEPVPQELLDKLRAQGYEFDAYPAPYTPEELRAMVFVWSCE
jgi:CheY-like chemotaxis protein